MFEDSDVHQVFETGLVIAIDKGISQNTFVLFSMRIEMIFQKDFVLRNGSCLVGTENIHRSEILDGME